MIPTYKRRFIIASVAIIPAIAIIALVAVASMLMKLNWPTWDIANVFGMVSIVLATSGFWAIAATLFTAERCNTSRVRASLVSIVTFIIVLVLRITAEAVVPPSIFIYAVLDPAISLVNCMHYVVYWPIVDIVRGVFIDLPIIGIVVLAGTSSERKWRLCAGSIALLFVLSNAAALSFINDNCNGSF